MMTYWLIGGVAIVDRPHVEDADVGRDVAAVIQEIYNAREPVWFQDEDSEGAKEVCSAGIKPTSGYSGARDEALTVSLQARYNDCYELRRERRNRHR